MMRKPFYLLLLLLAIMPGKLSAQDITGTWEGKMGGEFIQVNIIQDKNQLCGYTYDHYLNNKAEFCRAYFRGIYNSDTKTWMLKGVSFIQNSGGHTLMAIKMWKEPGDDRNKLHSVIGAKSVLNSLFGNMGDLVVLTRVSRKPAKLPLNMPVCYQPPKPVPKVTPNFPPKQPPVVVKDPPPVEPVITPEKPVADTPVKKIVPVAPIPDIPVQQMNERKKKPISHLTVNTRSISLSVYDNGTIDGDTVSIFYNGKLLAGKQRLSEKPLTFDIELDENAPVHEITMFADNLGSIPPNTALIVVKAGGKRYELYSSASLVENAVLVLEYKPE